MFRGDIMRDTWQIFNVSPFPVTYYILLREIRNKQLQEFHTLILKQFMKQQSYFSKK